MKTRPTIVSRLRAAVAGFRRPSARSTSYATAEGRGWWGLYDSTDSLGFQTDTLVSEDQQLAFFAVFACLTQIAGDIGKLNLRFMEKDERIWREIAPPTAYSRVMKRPNAFQTWQQFMEVWMVQKLRRGNFVAVKDRDERNAVVGLYPTDWNNVNPLIAPDGSVFYALQRDELAKLPTDIPAAPASEVLHDRATPLFHPLVGTPPLWAAALAASQGTQIQRGSAEFFKNMSRPSGMLIAPERIDDETAARIKTQWETNYGPGKTGRTAVLGDGLKYESLGQTPEDSQLTDQLGLTAKQVCSVFGVPGFMVGIGEPKSTDNVQALVLMYYAQCLQKHIEAAEALISEALGLDRGKYGVEFNLDDLLRMDSKTLADVEGVKVQRGISAPDESRAKFNLPPVTGGSKPYMQQQNYSLEALSKRESAEDPFGTSKPPAPAPAPAPSEDDQVDAAEEGARKAVEPVAMALKDVRALLERVSTDSAAAVDRLAAELAEQKAAAVKAAETDEFLNALRQQFAD